MSNLGNSLDLPFEEGPRGPLPDGHQHFSGGVVVMAAVINVPEVGPKPALVWRFATPDGDFYTPIVLVMDDDQIAKLAPLIEQSVSVARKAAAAS